MNKKEIIGLTVGTGVSLIGIGVQIALTRSLKKKLKALEEEKGMGAKEILQAELRDEYKRINDESSREI